MLTLLLSALAMTLIVGVRYLLTSGAFAWATKVKHPALYQGLDKQIGREIGWSLASAAIYGVPAGIVAWGWERHGWTAIYTDATAYPLWYLPVSVLLDPDAPRRESAVWKGQRREYWTWPHGEHRIWGATAAILVNLARAIRGN